MSLIGTMIQRKTFGLLQSVAHSTLAHRVLVFPICSTATGVLHEQAPF